jgi:hypothetical protein
VLTPEYHRRLAEHLIRLANITNDPKRAAALRMLAADHLVMTESGPPLAPTPTSSPEGR